MRAGRNLCAQWLGKALNLEFSSSINAELPLFLCPAFRTRPAAGLRLAAVTTTRPSSRPGIAPQWRRHDGCVRQIRRLSTEAEAAPVATAPAEEACDTHKEAPASEPSKPRRPSSITPRASRKTLPVQCSGCGALAQTSLTGQPGYFDLKRNAVQQYLGITRAAEKEAKRQGRQKREAERRVFEQALLSIDPDKLKGFSGMLLDLDRESPSAPPEPEEPLCDRCHNLVHQFQGEPIAQPTIRALRLTMDESPYKNNHVYHVIDAADFPMSLVPRITELLNLAPLRSLNRRAKHSSYVKGRKMEISFIISRADLLAPQKVMVDSIKPYLQEVLRDALGRAGSQVRLGNVYCVSAKLSWWCQDLREDIFKRGGAGWVVGKANVGKSQLFEAVFPKGRMGLPPPKTLISVPPLAKVDPEEVTFPPDETAGQQMEHDSPTHLLAPAPELEKLDEYSLLPPAPAETNYPKMPLVSAIPGTTASPIRVPFGNGRGELIDLPGLRRSDLYSYVKHEFRGSLLMEERLVPEQQVLRPGQSLLLGGGLIRITPRLDENSANSELYILSYNFTRLHDHRTSTAKAIAAQEEHEERPNLESIVMPGTGSKIKHAGAFSLQYDVTKHMAGPLTRRGDANIEVERLPYRVLSMDLLIEGCGWLELVAQVRMRHMYPGIKPKSKEAKLAATPSADTDAAKYASGDAGADTDFSPASTPTREDAAGEGFVAEEETDFSTWPDIRPGESYDDYGAPQHIPFNDEVWAFLDGGDDRATLRKMGHYDPVSVDPGAYQPLIRVEEKGDSGARHEEEDVYDARAEEAAEEFGDDSSFARPFTPPNRHDLETARDDQWRGHGRDYGREHDLDNHELEQHEEPPGPASGPILPIIDVFTPEGRFVAARRPMCAWLRNRRLSKATKMRPRPSMKGAKKEGKRVARQKGSKPGPWAAAGRA